MLRRFATFLVVASLGSAHADPGQTEWVATSNRAFAVMPATAVTDGKVGQVAWSPDGEHLLVAERPITTSREQMLRFDGSPPSLGSLELIGWDRRFHQVRDLWSTEDPTATIENVAWLRGTSVALITVRWVVRDGAQGAQHPMYGLLDMNTSNGKFRWVPGMEQLVARPLVIPSPTQPIAAVAFSDAPETADSLGGWLSAGNALVKDLDKLVLQFTLNDGAEVKTATLLEGSYWGLQSARPADNFRTLDVAGSVVRAVKVEKPIQLPLVWNVDGSAWFLVDADPKTKKSVLARLTDQGNLEPTNEQRFVPGTPERSLEIASVSTPVKHGKSQVDVQSLWLHARSSVDHGEMLLSADGGWPELSPTEGAVFYIDGGIAKVRELIPLTSDQQRAAHEQPKVAQLGGAGQPVRISFVLSGASPPTGP